MFVVEDAWVKVRIFILAFYVRKYAANSLKSLFSAVAESAVDIDNFGSHT